MLAFEGYWLDYFVGHRCKSIVAAALGSGPEFAYLLDLRCPLPRPHRLIALHMVVSSECALYECDRTEHTLLQEESNLRPWLVRVARMPDLPPAGLVLAATKRLPTASDQVSLPIQFLYASVNFAKMLGQLIYLLM